MGWVIVMSEKVSPKGERTVGACALLTRKTLHPQKKKKQSNDVPVPVPLFSSTLALPPNEIKQTDGPNECGLDVVQACWAKWPLSVSKFLVTMRTEPFYFIYFCITCQSSYERKHTTNSKGE